MHCPNSSHYFETSSPNVCTGLGLVADQKPVAVCRRSPPVVNRQSPALLSAVLDLRYFRWPLPGVFFSDPNHYNLTEFATFHSILPEQYIIHEQSIQKVALAYIYIYYGADVYVCVYVYIYIYICVKREREREIHIGTYERERERENKREREILHTFIHIYIYIQMSPCAPKTPPPRA